MAKEICISSTPHETRLAILEDDQLAEIYYERENEYTLAGSIYNGRVTRVLPGMQSAFVDVGLERDAFLYVTDFMEMEDQEDTDELEKAASSSPNQGPREVRHGGRNGQRNGQTHEARPSEEREPATAETQPFVSETPAFAEPLEDNRQADDEQGAKRWRGRRRRRGGRSGSGSQPERDEQGSATGTNPPIFQDSAEEVREIHGVAGNVPRGGSVPAPFVLPGEALSKYGGVPAETEKKPSFMPTRPAVTSKPSTLIDAPIEWDGSGLLPGESLSRHRSCGSEPEAETLQETA